MKTPTSIAATQQASSTLIPPAPTLTPLPSATPAPSRVIFVAPDNADPGLAGPVSLRLEELAREAGLHFEKRSSLSSGDIGPDVKIVAAVPPMTNLQELANADPQIQFLGIGLSGLSPSPNLSQIGSEELPPGQREFLAGAIAAIVSADWRTGIIVQEGSEVTSTQETAFANGMTYFCGLCRPVFPPYSAYPVIVQLAPGASQDAIQTATDTLAAKAVDVVFISQIVDSTPLQQALSAAGIHMITTSQPVSEIQENWAASLQVDPLPALDKIWPDLVQGKGSQNLSLNLTIQPGNPAILSPGKQTQAKKILQDLLDGFIDPGTQAR